MEQTPDKENIPETIDYLTDIHEATLDNYTNVQEKRPKIVDALVERILADFGSEDMQRRIAAKNGIRALVDKLYSEFID